MNIIPLDVALVASTIQDILRTSDDIGGRSVPVTRGSPPDDSAITENGWVGIYPESVSYQPRTLGIATGFMSYEARINLVVRYMHLSNPEELEDALEELVHSVVKVLLTNATLSGTVEAMSLGQVSYSDYGNSTVGFTQTAILSFTFTGSTEIID